MIKIESSNLNNLAQKHYKAIEKYLLNKNGGYSIESINEKIQSCFGSQTNLKKLILAKPHELEELSKVYKWKCCSPFNFFKTLYSYLNNYQDTKFYTLEDDKKKVPYRAYELIESLNIRVCPYCNRNTIYNIKNKKKRTSELDHFYPESKYPFFAISFYNLIPSCKVCNKIKLDNDDKEYINPYDRRFDFNKNMKFSLQIENNSFYYSENGLSFKYKIDDNTSSNERQRIKNNLDDFELIDLYDNHKDTVVELLQKAEIYNGSYLDELMDKYEGTLFKNREDLLRLVTCGYVNDEDLHKRPLSKLIKDISEELNFLSL